MKFKWKIIFILMFIMLVTGCSGQDQEDGLLLSEAEEILQEEDGGKEQQKEADIADTDVPGHGSGKETASVEDLQPLIYVQVSGAVMHPGVYALPEGSRVFQAVELAGGLTEKAEPRSLNQAQPVKDGEMIWVMTAGEFASQENVLGNPSADMGDKDDGKVNLNTATKEELMELPGIGAAKAAGIVAWREMNGSFAQIEDLMKIEGIKEGVFSKIEDYVKVQ